LQSKTVHSSFRDFRRIVDGCLFKIALALLEGMSSKVGSPALVCGLTAIRLLFGDCPCESPHVQNWSVSTTGKWQHRYCLHWLFVQTTISAWMV
jgi:hypothetical protein